MKNEKQVLELLQKTFFDKWGQHGATAELIDDMSARMTGEFSLGLFTAPPIPREYAEFLLLCDGYLYRGVRFFGTRAAQVGREGELPTLYDRNAAYVYNNVGAALPDGCLVLGDKGDRLFLYSAVTNRYLAVDAETMAEEESFASFEELFLSAVGKM